MLKPQPQKMSVRVNRSAQRTVKFDQIVKTFPLKPVGVDKNAFVLIVFCYCYLIMHSHILCRRLTDIIGFFYCSVKESAVC